MRKFAIIHLGRTNAGPNLLIETAKNLSQVADVSGVIYSADVFEPQQILDLDCPKLAISTYNSKMDFAKGLIFLPRSVYSILKFLRTNRITTLVFVMPHIWDPIVQPAIKIVLKLELICWIHDGEPHPGESALLHKILLKTNLYCANSVVTFSNHVGKMIEEKLIKNLIYLKLPRNEQKSPQKKKQGEVLFIGRINEYKGISRLVQAWTLVKTEDSTLHLTIAGSGKSEILEEVKRSLPHISLVQRNLTNSDFDNLINSSSLIVIPYDEASQSGIVVKASEFQIPYVVTPLPGLIEQAILHGGATVSTDMTPRSFATAIINSVKLGPDIPWQDSEEISWISQMRAFVTKLDLV